MAAAEGGGAARGADPIRLPAVSSGSSGLPGDASPANGRRHFQLTAFRQDVAALLVLVLLVLLFMWRVVFAGRVLLPLDTVFLMEPWKSEAPHSDAPVWNPTITDAVWASYPIASTVTSLRRTGSYFWDPYSMAGSPSWASGDLFSNPLLLLLSAFTSVAKAMSWAAVFSLLLGAAFTYLLLRELACGAWASLIASLAFIFNGYLVGWLSIPNMTGCMVWLPVVAWGIERSIRLRDHRWSLASGCAFALQIISGNIVCPLYGGITIGLLVSWRALSLMWHEKKLSAGLGPLTDGVITAVVGAGLAATSLFLTVELYFQTNRSAQAGARSGLDWTVHALRLLAPDLYGNALHGDTYRSAFNYVETNLYFGILPLFFIVAAVVASRHPLKWPLFGIGMAALLAVYNIPPFRQAIAWVYPVFLNTFPGRIFYIVAFCWSVLAGLGADWLFRHHPRRLLRILGGIAMAIALIPLCLAGTAIFFRTPPATRGTALGWFYWVRLFSVGSLLIATGHLVVASIIFWSWGRLRRPSTYIPGIVTACVIADLFVAGLNFNPAFDESLAFPDTPSLKLLQALQADHVGTARIATVPSGKILYGLSPEVYGLQSVSGYTSWALKRFARYIHLTQPVTTINHIFLTRCCSPLLNALNAKYIYTPDGVALENADQLDLIYDGPVKIYDNRAALPRAWVVHRVLSAPPEDLDAVADHLAAPGFSPAIEAVVEGGRELPGSDDGGAPPPYAEIVRYEPERVVVEVRLARDGLLVLSETMYPGWTARVDEQAAPIYYTNLFMRGVFLQPGEHRVDFVYRSTMLPVALAVSVATVVLVMGAAVILRGRRAAATAARR